jgi:hypothetical protein
VCVVRRACHGEDRQAAVAGDRVRRSS